jgi:hypothetical protein
MPTVLRQEGFRFQIFTDDHAPAHLHIFKAGTELVINLGDENLKPWIRDNKGMSRKDSDNALLIVLQNQAMFLEEWEKIHGKDS